MTAKRGLKDRTMIGSGGTSSNYGPAGELMTAHIENGQAQVKGNHCEHCGKYTLFLLDKSGHKLCPNCANDKSIIQIFQARDEMAKLKKEKEKK